MSDLAPQQSTSFFRVQERDILAELLNNKRSQETKRAYPALFTNGGKGRQMRQIHKSN